MKTKCVTHNFLHPSHHPCPYCLLDRIQETREKIEIIKMLAIEEYSDNTELIEKIEKSLEELDQEMCNLKNSEGN